MFYKIKNFLFYNLKGFVRKKINQDWKNLEKIEQCIKLNIL